MGGHFFMSEVTLQKLCFRDGCSGDSFNTDLWFAPISPYRGYSSLRTHTAPRKVLCS